MFKFAITKHQRQLRDAAFALCGHAVEAARRQDFYVKHGVPDTVDGRFDLIVMHLFLLIHSMQRFNTPASVSLQQGLFDVLFADMDRNLREMGVGDLGVPRRIRAMMQAFNGRCHAYAQGIENGGADLIDAICKNIYRGDNNPGAGAIGDYMQMKIAELNKFQWDDFYQGKAGF